VKIIVGVVCMMILATVATGKQQTCTSSERNKWIGSVLTEIHPVKPGMTREDFMKVFAPSSGFFKSTTFSGTYTYKGCPYIMVDVEFSSASGDDNASGGSPKDRIKVISKPYLATPEYD